MAIEIVMPAMGAEMEEGAVVRWLKQPGDAVARGETIAQIETDKATVDLESFDDGTFERVVVPEGGTVPVGQVVAYLTPLGETAAPAPQPAATTNARLAEATSETAAQAVAPPEPVAAAEIAQPQPAIATPSPNGNAEPGRRLRVSPVARQIAGERGLDLTQLRGSGPDGRIMRRDVEAATAGRVGPAPMPEIAKEQEPAPAAVQYETTALEPAAPAPTRSEAPPLTQARASAEPAAVAPRPAMTGQARPLSRMRQAIARRMAQSKREAPHYYVTVDVDMTKAMSLRKELNAAAGSAAHITVNDLLIKAAAMALRTFPAFNASFGEQGLIEHSQINICIGVALPEGLIAPALLNCGGKSLGAIAQEARDLGERAKNGGLRPAELSDGTFTISNLGAYGVETLIAIIQPPQAAIIGAGMVESRPVVREGAIVIREMLKLALSADHRVTDGAEGAEFMREVKNILETPLRLAL